MTGRIYEILIEPDEFEDGTPAFTATCPAVKGCVTWGYTVDEALKNVHEALELCLEVMEEHGDPIPEGIDAAKMTVKMPASFYVSV